MFYTASRSTWISEIGDDLQVMWLASVWRGPRWSRISAQSCRVRTAGAWISCSRPEYFTYKKSGAEMTWVSGEPTIEIVSELPGASWARARSAEAGDKRQIAIAASMQRGWKK